LPHTRGEDFAGLLTGVVSSFTVHRSPPSARRVGWRTERQRRAEAEGGQGDMGERGDRERDSALLYCAMEGILIFFSISNAKKTGGATETRSSKGAAAPAKAQKRPP